MTSLDEIHPQPVADRLGIKMVIEPMVFPGTQEEARAFDSIEEVVRTAATLSPAKAEGFVVVTRDFATRVKVKSPAYVLTALLPRTSSVVLDRPVMPPDGGFESCGDSSEKQQYDEVALQRLCRIVAMGEGEEFACAFPNLRDSLEALTVRMAALVLRLEASFDKVQSEVFEAASNSPSVLSESDIQALLGKHAFKSLTKGEAGLMMRMRKGQTGFGSVREAFANGCWSDKDLTKELQKQKQHEIN